MSTVTILPSGKTIEASEGMSLLEAVLAADENILHKCDGNAQCGSCHIFVQAGKKGLSRPQAPEHQKLDTIVGVGSKSRLACQTKILGTEDVTVELLGFASGF